MSRFDIDVKRIPLEFSPETANPAVPVQRKGESVWAREIRCRILRDVKAAFEVRNIGFVETRETTPFLLSLHSLKYCLSLSTKISFLPEFICFTQRARRGQGADQRLHDQGQSHSERRHREVGREDPGRQLLEVRAREGCPGHDKWAGFIFYFCLTSVLRETVVLQRVWDSCNPAKRDMVVFVVIFSPCIFCICRFSICDERIK